ncbi:MAG TPA: hypothetical protein VMW58_03450, partial [Anaerolineae bacterium]|nr:hypothetical protein [Anaerolineae bacterium]
EANLCVGKTRKREDLVRSSRQSRHEGGHVDHQSLTKVPTSPTMLYVPQVAQVVEAQPEQPPPPRERLTSPPFPPLLTAQNREMARRV